MGYQIANRPMKNLTSKNKTKKTNSAADAGFGELTMTTEQNGAGVGRFRETETPLAEFLLFIMHKTSTEKSQTFQYSAPSANKTRVV